jgi:hypothetical protein
MNAPQPLPTSSAAIVSIAAGVASWVLLPMLAALVAIVAGHMARGEIRRSGGQIQGDALALVGLVLGYINLLLGLAVILAIAFGVFALAGLAWFSGA